MPTFKEKPTYVDAVQVTADRMERLAEKKEWIEAFTGMDVVKDGQLITQGVAGLTVAGTHSPRNRAEVGDWIVTYENGERMICSSAEFESRFVPVENNDI